MLIGSYQGWSGRNYSGQIDEVRIWNRSLSQDEIRELRHITLSQQMIDADSDLLAYYQFNEQEGGILDRKGINHAALTGAAQRSISDGPFGKGESDRITISSTGFHSFSNTESSVSFANGSTIPDGEVVLSRIHILPNALPANGINFNDYFVLNNYGSNNSFDAENLILKPANYTQPQAGWQVALHHRGENEYLNDWIFDCNTSQFGTNGLEFGSGCTITDAAQFFPVTDQFVGLNQVEKEVEVSVYPNPILRNGEVQIDNSRATDVRFTLYNSQGKIVASETIASGDKYRFVPSTAAGVYTYSLHGASFIKNGKLVVN